MGEGPGFNAALFYGRAAGTASGAAQKKKASRTTERHYEMDIPTHCPRLPGEIIPVKSSADHRPVTDAGRARVEQFRTAHFFFSNPNLPLEEQTSGKRCLCESHGMASMDPQVQDCPGKY